MDYNLERLRRTEETLRQLGCAKCNVCDECETEKKF